jgi:hypothetical protein
VKFADNVFTVRIRLNCNKGVTDEEKDLIFDSIGQRRFALYQKWLVDSKKSNMFEKCLEGVEMPSKCPKLTSIDIPSFDVAEIQDIFYAPNIFKQTVNIICLFYKTTLMGDFISEDKTAQPIPIQAKLSNDTEQLAYRIKMMQRNQFILFGLLSISLMILLFQGTSRR